MAKNIKKIIPFVMFATLLSSCSNELTLKDGEDKTIVKENASYEDLDLTTYQEVFDDLFTASGAEVASKELVYRIAKQIVENIDSEDEKTQKLEKGLLGKDGTYIVAGYTFKKQRLAEKVKEKFNDYYNTAYKTNGLFDERLLANSLRLSGYNVTLPEDYYKETKDSLLRYGNLADKLKGDYTELIEEKLLKDIYLELLKEEYIITQHPEYLKSTQTSSETAYSAYSKVKYVEYFSYTPTKSSDANKINEQIEKALDTVLEIKNQMSGDAKVVTAYIDEVQIPLTFNAEAAEGECEYTITPTNAYGSPTTQYNYKGQTIASKKELGDDYAMKPASPIEKEWFEQAAAFEDYLVGKTVSEINLEDSSLLAGCTMYAGAYEAACDNAVDSTLYNSKAITL